MEAILEISERKRHNKQAILKIFKDVGMSFSVKNKQFLVEKLLVNADPANVDKQTVEFLQQFKGHTNLVDFNW